MDGLLKCLIILLIIARNLSVFAQGRTGTISGTVTDPNGTLVAGATVEVSNTTTYKGLIQTSALNVSGTIGAYTMTITAIGFKQSVVTEFKVDSDKPFNINVKLGIGSANESVTGVSGDELLQTQSATTVGYLWQSSVNGQRTSATNITVDGINVQDNLLKSNDGCFTYVRPRTDTISEVSVSTATPGAENSAEGAVQIKFVTPGGTNDYHGGFYGYHHNPAFNANYWLGIVTSRLIPSLEKHLKSERRV